MIKNDKQEQPRNYLKATGWESHKGKDLTEHHTLSTRHVYIEDTVGSAALQEL